MIHHRLAMLFSSSFHQALMVGLVMVALFHGALDAGRQDRLNQYFNMSLSELTQYKVQG